MFLKPWIGGSDKFYILLWKLLNFGFFILNLFGVSSFCRDKVFCGVRTWNTAHGRPPKSDIWIVHRLCPKEPVLWDGDAYTMRALWHQHVTGNTEGSRCFIGAMNLPRFYFNTSVIFLFHLCICHEIFQVSCMLNFVLIFSAISGMQFVYERPSVQAVGFLIKYLCNVAEKCIIWPAWTSCPWMS